MISVSFSPQGVALTLPPACASGSSQAMQHREQTWVGSSWHISPSFLPCKSTVSTSQGLLNRKGILDRNCFPVP